MVYLIISFVFAIIGGLASWYADVSLLEFAVFCLWLNNIAFALTNTKRHIVFLLFNVTFFTFLLGKPFSSMLATDPAIKSNIVDTFSTNTQVHIYSCIILSLVTLLWAYCYMSSKHETPYTYFDYCNLIIKKYRRKAKTLSYRDFISYLSSKYGASYAYIDYSNSLIKKYRRTAKILSYIFFFFALVVNLEKMMFVISVGYIEYYTEFHSTLPLIVSKVANYYNLAFYFFLVTMPTKKDARIPIILFLIVGVSSMGFGQRNGLVLSIVMMALYFTIRQKMRIYGPNERWITKRMVFCILIILPFFLTFLMAFNDIRNKENFILYNSMWNNMLSFFHQQGGSVSIIGYEYDFHDSFPQDFPYSLGYFVDRFTNIEFIKPLHLFPAYAPKSYELAVYGHNFGETITYMQDPSTYFAGGGIGSCYIAEIYHDFGYIGVILINVLYAFIFSRFDKISGRNIWVTFCLFIIIDRVLYSPRADALGCFTEFLTSSFIIFVVLMSIVGKNKSNIKV